VGALAGDGRLSAVAYSTDAAAAILTLDRPERLNAFDPAMVDEVIAALDRADADDAVRAVIVTGADLTGGEAAFDFVADGADPAAAAAAFRDPAGVLALRLLRSTKPVIAAVNGAAVGMGATITLPMDIRIASTEARFGFLFTRRGMVPEGASAWFLPRIVGIGRAQEWVCTGRVFDSSEALRAGLVHSVHEPDALLEAAHGIVAEIAAHTAPVSVALARRMLWSGVGAPEGALGAHRVDSLATILRGRAGDAGEGVRAFKEKRPPAFPDLVSDGLPSVLDW
jgi:enoyl-CoA hydratase/carnithine racemase